MAAKKKRGEAGYDPKLRAKALLRLAALDGERGAIARVANEIGVPQSAVQYWAATERAKRERNGNGRAAPPPPAVTNGNGKGNGHDVTRSPKPSPGLAAVEAQLEEALSSVRAMRESWRSVFGDQ